MSYCNQQFALYNERKKTFHDIYNRDTNEGIKHLTGLDEQLCAYRYAKIHGAVELMGGWANCSHWIQNHANNYFNTCENILGLAKKYSHKLSKEDRLKFNEELKKMLEEENENDENV